MLAFLAWVDGVNRKGIYQSATLANMVQAEYEENVEGNIEIWNGIS